MGDRGAVPPPYGARVTHDAVGPTQIQRMNQQRINFVNADPETALSEAAEAVKVRLPELRTRSPILTGPWRPSIEQGQVAARA